MTADPSVGGSKDLVTGPVVRAPTGCSCNMDEATTEITNISSQLLQRVEESAAIC